MIRLTISLTEGTHRALVEAAARQDRSTGSIIEECLRLRGIRPFESAGEIIARARNNANLDTDSAMALAVKETVCFRKGR